MFYELKPEVAGQLGDDTVMDRSTHPPIVHACHYEFDGWLGDELLQSFPCFIVTDNLKTLIESAKPSGCSFGSVKVTTSEEYEAWEEAFPLPPLPHFHRLLVEGIAGRDDFGLSSTFRLVVSDRMLKVLKQGRLEVCRVRPL
jgi:hypothetical protein